MAPISFQLKKGQNRSCAMSYTLHSIDVSKSESKLVKIRLLESKQSETQRHKSSQVKSSHARVCILGPLPLLGHRSELHGLPGADPASDTGRLDGRLLVDENVVV